MTGNEKTAAMIAAFLFLWFWQKGYGDVALKQTCTFPDGSEIETPLGSACPYDAAHGGQSQVQEK